MPLYEYECEACGKRFEKIQKFSDPPADVCAHCGKGPVNKLLSSPAIQFKGSGWYITDYAKKSSTDSASKPSGSDAASTSTDTKTAATETKTAEPAAKKD
jgi:putative FmdB family regulatory protein